MSKGIVDYWYSYLNEWNSKWYYFRVFESNTGISNEEAMALAVAQFFDIDYRGDPEEFLKKQKGSLKTVPEDRVRLSDDMLRKGKSDNGGFNKKQILALGESWPLKKGWYGRLLGKLVDKQAYQVFLSYKNKHLKQQ